MTRGLDGNIYSLVGGNGSVVRHDGITGTFLGTFIGPGAPFTAQPEALAQDVSGNWYIADSDDVFKYNVGGSFVTVFPVSGGGGWRNRDIVVAPSGHPWAGSFLVARRNLVARQILQ